MIKKNYKASTTKTSRRRTQKINPYLLPAAISAVLVAMAIGYFFFASGTQSNSRGNALARIASRETTPYQRTRLSKIPFDKASEISKPLNSGKLLESEVAEIKYKQGLLLKMTNIWEVVPWEIKYKRISEQEINSNPTLANHRLEMMLTFEPVLEKLDIAINNPTDQTYAELLESIRNSDYDIQKAINGT